MGTVFSGVFYNDERWYSVYRNGKPFDPGPSLAVRNHSPTGFAWGYQGSGPAQLALAILLEVTKSAEAQDAYQDFKREVISHLDGREGVEWAMPDFVVFEWLVSWRAQRARVQNLEKLAEEARAADPNPDAPPWDEA